MKKLFLSTILVFFLTQSASAMTLVPSLQFQMARQSAVDKEALTFTIKVSNQQRLAAIRARNSVSQPTLSAQIVQTPVKTESVATTLVPQLSLIPAIQSPQVTTTQSNTLSTSTHTPSNVDMNKLRNTWLSWNNAERINLGLAPYSIDSRLNATATEWSEFAVSRGYITHGRPGDGCLGTRNYICYNFSAIDTWFKARGIDPVIIGRAKHTENIGLGYYRCSSSDCTDAAIAAARKTFDFFMSEKSYNGSHYRSLTSPVFTKIGFGFTVDPSRSTYYLTVHYITY